MNSQIATSYQFSLFITRQCSQWWWWWWPLRTAFSVCYKFLSSHTSAYNNWFHQLKADKSRLTAAGSEAQVTSRQGSNEGLSLEMSAAPSFHGRKRTPTGFKMIKFIVSPGHRWRPTQSIVLPGSRCRPTKSIVLPVHSSLVLTNCYRLLPEKAFFNYPSLKNSILLW